MGRSSTDMFREEVQDHMVGGISDDDEEIQEEEEEDDEED